MGEAASFIFAVMMVLNHSMTVLGLDKNSITDQQQIYCGAQNVYFESQGEPDLGMVAVSQVVINRVKSARWPNTVCEVVWQNKQFSWTHDGKSDKIPLSSTYQRRLWIKSVYMFLIAYGDDITNGATHYHNVKVKPWWASRMKVTAHVGNHIFLKEK
jgi:spore germination cell wall hydrolase CwlJ-like protein